MQDNLTAILIRTFKRAELATDEHLGEKVWLAITLRDKRVVRIKLWTFAFVILSSFALLIPTFKILGSDLAQSGFFEYFSLIFQGNGLLLSYWKELSFSILESLPVVSVIFTFSLIFICYLSMKHFMRQIINRNRFILSA
jgi:hypothetical protein